MLQGPFVQRILPSGRIVAILHEMGLCSCFELNNAYLHVGKNHYLIEMRSNMFKKSDFLQRNATY